MHNRSSGSWYRAAKHYNLNVGMLQVGDDADFIVVDDFKNLVVKQTYIKGVLVAEKGRQ